MGHSGAGKSSMKSIIFAHIKDSNMVLPINKYSSAQYILMGNLILELVDCGGYQIIYVHLVQINLRSFI